MNYCWDDGNELTTEYVSNLSQDATSPNNNFRNKKINFVDIGKEDFHLSLMDAGAIDRN